MTYLRAEPGNPFMDHIASKTQKLAYREAVDLSYPPSAVKAVFSRAGLRANLQEKRADVQLLYDSLAQLAAAGTRSIGMRVRQMLYRAEPYQIDIQIEAQPDRNRLIVTGQLIDVGRPELLDGGIEVTLSDGRGNIVNTVTNQFGEFRGEVILSGDLDLSFPSRDGKPIVTLLRGMLDPASGGKN
ncbi:MAG TPA: hypothetical protein VJN92_11140 [Candidatus Acidoferrum sp.]|nr:hypothetical protein [Candidatus Acidoferrum sp.]